MYVYRIVLLQCKLNRKRCKRNNNKSDNDDNDSGRRRYRGDDAFNIQSNLICYK